MKTRKQMRLAIARDVLAQLDAKVLKARRGTYLSGGPSLVYELDAQAALLDTKRSNPCRACAIGSGAIAAVRLYNNCTGAQINFNRHAVLAVYFTWREQATLEGLFEGWLGHTPVLRKLSDELALRFIWGYVIRTKGAVINRTKMQASAKRYAKKHDH